jgi:xanthine/CO dehydrogenase XdhC/CoxF family maturation factor
VLRVSDFDQVLKLWQDAKSASEDYVLASIVRVEGSSYRKPGARMLITKSGRRAGTISGGCLEAEVSKQAWWLTQGGPVVKAYSTSFETDGDRPYGLGCGGVVYLLLERRATADVFLQRAFEAFEKRRALACAVVLEGAETGQRGFDGAIDDAALALLAADALRAEQSSTHILNSMKVWAEYLPPRCGLFVFGAGDDAQPLVAQASTLGWQITVADGRSHLATKARFPQAHAVVVLKDGDVSGMDLHAGDAAVVMTHGFEQDSKILGQLLPQSLLYLGVLGPRYRTADLVKSAVEKIGGTAAEWMATLHAPVGMDIGGDSPATIALSILAEIQATLTRRLRTAADRVVSTRIPERRRIG